MSIPRVFVLSGPSGVGKSSIIDTLLARKPNLRLSVSTTTRPRREGEVAGQQYFFVDQARFQHMIEQEEFLEWARIYDNCYGTGVRQIEDSLSANLHALLDLDTQGAMQIKRTYDGAVYFFIKPPSLADLEARLRGRATETEQVLSKRLARAEHEISFSDQYDHVIVNDAIEEAVQALIDIIDREEERPVKFVKRNRIHADSIELTVQKAARYARQRIDDEALVQSLEEDVKNALRSELEALIRERLEHVLRHDLSRILEEAYEEAITR